MTLPNYEWLSFEFMHHTLTVFTLATLVTAKFILIDQQKKLKPIGRAALSTFQPSIPLDCLILMQWLRPTATGGVIY